MPRIVPIDVSTYKTDKAARQNHDELKIGNKKYRSSGGTSGGPRHVFAGGLECLEVRVVMDDVMLLYGFLSVV